MEIEVGQEPAFSISEERQHMQNRLVVRTAVEVTGGSRRERFEAAELLGRALAQALEATARTPALRVIDGGQTVVQRSDRE